jgi:hypothetical protein
MNINYYEAIEHILLIIGKQEWSLNRKPPEKWWSNETLYKGMSFYSRGRNRADFFYKQDNLVPIITIRNHYKNIILSS